MKVVRLRKSAILPQRKTVGSVGYDVHACIEDSSEDGSETINPGETKMIGSGIAIALKEGQAAFVYARSGLATKHGIAPANCVGVIDFDYRGEIIVPLRNSSEKPYIVRNGDSIAQMVITKCELPEVVLCDSLDNTTRGSGGFGSTG